MRKTILVLCAALALAGLAFFVANLTEAGVTVDPDSVNDDQVLHAADSLYPSDNTTVHNATDPAFSDAFPAHELYIVRDHGYVPPLRYAMAYNPDTGDAHDLTLDYNDLLSSYSLTIDNETEALTYAQAFAHLGNAELQLHREMVNSSDSERLGTHVDGPYVDETLDGWRVLLTTWTPENGVLANWEIRFTDTQLERSTWTVDELAAGDYDKDWQYTNFQNDTRVRTKYDLVTGSHTSTDAYRVTNDGEQPLLLRNEIEDLAWDAVTSGQNFDNSTWTAYVPNGTDVTPALKNLSENLTAAGVWSYGWQVIENVGPGDCSGEKNPNTTWAFPSKDPDCNLEIRVLPTDALVCGACGLQNNNTTVNIHQDLESWMLNTLNYSADQFSSNNWMKSGVGRVHLYDVAIDSDVAYLNATTWTYRHFPNGTPSDDVQVRSWQLIQLKNITLNQRNQLVLGTTLDALSMVTNTSSSKTTTAASSGSSFDEEGYVYEGYRWGERSPSLDFTYDHSDAGDKVAEDGSTTSLPQSEVVGAFDAAGNTWDSDLPSRFGAQVSSTGNAGHSCWDGTPTLTWADLGGKGSDGIVLGDAYPCFDILLQLRDYDIRYNNHPDLGWCHCNPIPDSVSGKITMDLEAVATHEIGHTINLGHPGPEVACDLATESAQIMFWYVCVESDGSVQRSLGWGDAAGVRFVYPTAPSLGSAGSNHAGHSVAIHDIADVTQTGRMDLVSAYVKDKSNENVIQYEIGWDLNEQGSVTGGWGGPVQLPSGVGYETEGLGTAIAHIGSGSRPDIIVAWVDNPLFSNDVLYRIGWDLKSNGAPEQWSSIKEASISPGWSTNGLGVSIADIDADNNLDVVMGWANPACVCHGDWVGYSVGWNIDNDGVANSWSDSHYLAVNPDGEMGIGTSVGHFDDDSSLDIAMHFAHEPTFSPAYSNYRIGYGLGSNGDHSSRSDYNYIPGGDKSWAGSVQGVGVASGDLNSHSRDELLFGWIHDKGGNNDAHYTIEWETMITNHP